MEHTEIERVLIVDDDRDAADLTALLLARSFPKAAFDVGYGGAQAVTLACEHRPDVVLLDFDMPTVSGVQAAAAIRNSFPGTSPLLILLTGHAAAAVACGAGTVFDRVLDKPLDLDLLLRAIEKA